jgi:hypothetical protein
LVQKFKGEEKKFQSFQTFHIFQWLKHLKSESQMSRKMAGVFVGSEFEGLSRLELLERLERLEQID